MCCCLSFGKGLISHFKENGIIVLTKPVDEQPEKIAKKLEEINSLLRGSLEREWIQKGLNISTGSISNFFGVVQAFR